MRIRYCAWKRKNVISWRWLSFFRSFECRLQGLTNGHVIFTWSANERFETSGSRRGNRERKSAETRAKIQVAKKSARWRKAAVPFRQLPPNFFIARKEKIATLPSSTPSFRSIRNYLRGEKFLLSYEKSFVPCFILTMMKWLIDGGYCSRGGEIRESRNSKRGGACRIAISNSW